MTEKKVWVILRQEGEESYVVRAYLDKEEAEAYANAARRLTSSPKTDFYYYVQETELW